MNATDAINRIVDLLGLKFKKETFQSTRLNDNTTEITNNLDTDFAIGDTLYLVGDSTLTPAEEGEYNTREGLSIYVDAESTIFKIEEETQGEETPISTKEDEVAEENEKTDMMSSAVLADGTKIETDGSGEFKVGDQLYVITKEGEKVSAPEGEHTTESGITIVVDGKGIITGVKYPDKTGEGSMGKDMTDMKYAMTELLSMITEMNGKFKTELNSLKTEFNEFKKQPDRAPVVKTISNSKENLMDLKLELIKKSTNKN